MNYQKQLVMQNLFNHIVCPTIRTPRLRFELLFWHMVRYKCRLLTYLLTCPILLGPNCTYTVLTYCQYFML